MFRAIKAYSGLYRTDCVSIFDSYPGPQNMARLVQIQAKIDKPGGL
jgi:hypothetical protein